MGVNFAMYFANQKSFANCFARNISGIKRSKEYWQNCYGTLLDNFLEIDAIIGDIIFLYGFAGHVLHSVREKVPFSGHC